jgi:tetratricopeptide (TPR) repeat protein
MRVLQRVGIVLAALFLLLAAVDGRSIARDIEYVRRRANAERLFRAQEFPAADTAFAALVSDATRGIHSDAMPSLTYNSGVVAYRRGRFEMAAARLRGGLAGDSRLQEWTDYDTGNSYVWQSRSEYNRTDKETFLRSAVESYEQALLLDSHDRDAKWNLEIALRRLDEVEAGASGRGRREEANWGGGNLTKSGYQGAPQAGGGATPGGGYGAGHGEDAVPDVTETQARRMLKAVERAQVTGQDVQSPQRRRPQPPSHDKDW